MSVLHIYVHIVKLRITIVLFRDQENENVQDYVRTYLVLLPYSWIKERLVDTAYMHAVAGGGEGSEKRASRTRAYVLT